MPHHLEAEHPFCCAAAHADGRQPIVRGCISCGSASLLVVAARGPGSVCCRQDYAELAGLMEEADLQDLSQDNLGCTDLATEDAGGVPGCRQQWTSRRAWMDGLLCFLTSAAGTVMWAWSSASHRISGRLPTQAAHCVLCGACCALGAKHQAARRGPAVSPDMRLHWHLSLHCSTLCQAHSWQQPWRGVAAHTLRLLVHWRQRLPTTKPS